MLVIRFQRRGKKNQPFFWIVVAQKTAPVRGKFIEKLGFWNPIKKIKGINEERVKYWLSKGAEISDSVYNLLVDEKIVEGEKRKIKIKKKKIEEEKVKEEMRGEALKDTEIEKTEQKEDKAQKLKTSGNVTNQEQKKEKSEGDESAGQQKTESDKS